MIQQTRGKFVANMQQICSKYAEISQQICRNVVATVRQMCRKYQAKLTVKSQQISGKNRGNIAANVQK
jgi:hypothetical protein